jgi:hypothetical protein
MPGPAGINFRNIEIDAGIEMRPGDLVSVRVKDVLPGGRLGLLWRGRTITAKTNLFFRPGQVLTAKVELREGGMRLRLVDARAGADVKGAAVSGRGVENIATRALLSSALLRAGLPLPDDSEIARRTALLERTKGRRLLMARLFAELFSKGADSGADFLEAVGGILDGGGDRRGRGSGGGGGPMREWRHPPGAGELSSEAAEEGSDENPLLALMSEAGGRSGDWAFRRMRRRLGGRDMDLVWKIRGGSNPAVALTVRDGERVFEFLMEGSEFPSISCFTDGKTAVDEKAWNNFRDRLALLNFTVSDTLLTIGESDGFTSGALEAARNLEERL